MSSGTRANQGPLGQRKSNRSSRYRRLYRPHCSRLLILESATVIFCILVVGRRAELRCLDEEGMSWRGSFTSGLDWTGLGLD